MVAGHARNPEPAAARADQAQRPAVVDLVQRARRRERRIGPYGGRLAEAVPRRALEVEDLEGAREQLRPPDVEVAGDHTRSVSRHRGELRGIDEEPDLPRLLPGRRPQLQAHTARPT